MAASERQAEQPTQPSPARMYDYYLGGNNNFPIDRMAAEKVLELHPGMRYSARANRAFLRRAVALLAEQGIDQFIDIGSGIPTEGNVHEVAQAINADARVVYVDIDPTAIAYGQMLLGDARNVASIVADVREPDTIFSHSQTQKLIDSSQPVAILLVAIMHFIPNDQEMHTIVRTIRNSVPRGSYLVFSQAAYTADIEADQRVTDAEDVYSQSTQAFKIRARAQIHGIFDDWDALEHGLVDAVLRRPEADEEQPLSYYIAGVARKP